MAVTLEPSQDVTRHLELYNICPHSLISLGERIIDDDHKGRNVSGVFRIIAEGYGSSVKLKFTVYYGQGDNSPRKTYFVRILHDPAKARTQLAKEVGVIKQLEPFPHIYANLKDGKGYTVLNMLTATPVPVGVFSWGHERFNLPMSSLDALLRADLDDALLDKLCDKLEETLHRLALKLQEKNEKREEDFEIGDLEVLPPDYWLDIKSLPQGVPDDEYVNYEVTNKIPSDVRPVTCLNILGDRSQFWLVGDESHSKGENVRLPAQQHWKPYTKVLVASGFLLQSKFGFGNQELRHYEAVVKKARCHNDLHPGNILAYAHPSNRAVDILFLDFCDVDDNALLLSDFAFLTFMLCLALADTLHGRIRNVCNLMQGEHSADDRDLKVFAAIKRAQNQIAGKEFPRAELVFTYWYVAHRFLRYVLLGDKSDNYKTVVREWLDYWNPRRIGEDYLRAAWTDYARSLGSEWENEKKRLANLSRDNEQEREEKIEDQRRIDCYVDPVLKWKIERTVDAEIYENVDGDPADQPLNAFEKCQVEKKWLVIVDGGGAGKSVLAKKLASDLSKRSSENKFPYLVFFWESKLPKGDGNELPHSLRECLLLDKRYQACCKNEALLDLALNEGRVVVILDGYDELTEKEKRFFEKGVNVQANAMGQVRWIVTGREYVFISRGKHLWPDYPDRGASAATSLRIEPFTDAQQDKYFEKAGINLGWRNVLQSVSDEDRQRLVSLPQTLRLLLKLIERFQELPNQPSSLPQIESGSDLFLQVFELSLESELRKFELPPRYRSDRRKAYRVVERTISYIAFLMAKRDLYRAIVSGSKPTDTVCDEIEAAVEAKLKSVRVRPKLWKWARDIIPRLISNHPAAITPLSAKTFAFQHRILLECHCANYLVSYATEEELATVRKRAGDPEWDHIWHAAIEMPLYQSSKLLQGERILGADSETYAKALKTLFHRPEANTKHRRPSRLMHETLEWLNRKNPPSQYRREFRELATDLRKGLAQELGEIEKQGTSEQRAYAAPLKLLNDSDRSAYIHMQGVKGIESPFYISRTLILNGELQLYDPGHAHVHDQANATVDKRCAEPNAPAILCSWYDACMFALFVGPLANQEDIAFLPSLPRSRQLMACIHRVRHKIFKDTGELRILEDEFWNFESLAASLRHPRPDSLGTIGLFNSGFEWCLHDDNAQDKDIPPWPNEYYVVPRLRPKGRRIDNVVFRIALNQLPHHKHESGLVER